MSDVSDERDGDFRRLVRSWLVAEGWPPIEGEVLLQVTAPGGGKRILRLRPAGAGGVKVLTKRGTLRWVLSPLASDASGYSLPAEMLARLVHPVPASAGLPRSRRPSVT